MPENLQKKPQNTNRLTLSRRHSMETIIPESPMVMVSTGGNKKKLKKNKNKQNRITKKTKKQNKRQLTIKSRKK